MVPFFLPKSEKTDMKHFVIGSIPTPLFVKMEELRSVLGGAVLITQCAGSNRLSVVERGNQDCPGIDRYYFRSDSPFSTS